MYIRPMDLEEHQKLGDLLLSQKQYVLAAREFEALLALNTPDKAGAYYKLAEADFGQGEIGRCANKRAEISGNRAIIRARAGIVIKNSEVICGTQR